METLRVLIVDDQVDVADSLGKIVKGWGYETEVAYHGADALEKAAQSRPHVVLLDIMMPGIDGYKVATQLKNLGEVTIIGCTALSDDSFRHRGWDTGFHFYLVKPIDPEKLRKILVDLSYTLEVEAKRRERRAGQIEGKILRRLG